MWKVIGEIVGGVIGAIVTIVLGFVGIRKLRIRNKHQRDMLTDLAKIGANMKIEYKANKIYFSNKNDKKPDTNDVALVDKILTPEINSLEEKLELNNKGKE